MLDILGIVLKDWANLGIVFNIGDQDWEKLGHHVQHQRETTGEQTAIIFTEPSVLNKRLRYQ